MAGVTNQSARVILRIYPREPFRLRARCFMTLGAQRRRVGLNGRDRQIACMLALRTVASLAIHARVFSFGLFIRDIGVAGFAGLVAGVYNRQCRNLRDRVAAVVAVLPEAPRNEYSPHSEKSEQADHKHNRDPNEMFRVFHRARERNSRPIAERQWNVIDRCDAAWHCAKSRTPCGYQGLGLRWPRNQFRASTATRSKASASSNKWLAPGMTSSWCSVRAGRFAIAL
jgi:hypothetical protein